MKNLKAYEMFEEISKDGNTSEELRFIHDEFIHFFDLDSNVFDKQHQTALYTLSMVIKAFREMEKVHLSSETRGD